MVQLLTTQLADYHLYFVCIRQFVTSPWGYGGSVPDCSDGLSFQVGQAQLALVAISVLISLFLLWKRKQGYSIIILFICMFAFSLFIQTKYSVFIWNSIQPFSYIQFPWRFLTFSDFTSASLGAYLFTIIKNEKIKIFLAAAMIIILIFMNKCCFVPEKYLSTVT